MEVLSGFSLHLPPCPQPLLLQRGIKFSGADDSPGPVGFALAFSLLTQIWIRFVLVTVGRSFLLMSPIPESPLGSHTLPRELG